MSSVSRSVMKCTTAPQCITNHFLGMQLEQVEPRTSWQSCPQAGTIRVHTSNAHEVAAVDLRLSFIELSSAHWSARQTVNKQMCMAFQRVVRTVLACTCAHAPVTSLNINQHNSLRYLLTRRTSAYIEAGSAGASAPLTETEQLESNHTLILDVYSLSATKHRLADT